MKEVLVITNYFPPETGAASNRIYHLAEGLQKRNYKVQVVTPLPNYPTGKIFNDYKGKFKRTSFENQIEIHRLWIYASNSKNKVLRLVAMLSYSLSLVWFFAFKKIPKTVIIQSPPLLVAFTSVLFLRSKKRKLILNVSDLWPLAGLELGAFKKGMSYSVLERMERFNYKHANLVLGQSEEILTHVRGHFPNKPTFLYRNFPHIERPDLSAYRSPENKIHVVYAGLLGVAQGVYKLCRHLDYSRIHFHIYGDGAERQQIESFLQNASHDSITYHGSVSREELHSEILTYDIAIIPLLNRIYGSVPSKIFEFSKLGMPLLYFGGGEGETIIRDYNLGWVANVGDYGDLNNVIEQIDGRSIDLNFRKGVLERAQKAFQLDSQLDTLAKTIDT